MSKKKRSVPQNNNKKPGHLKETRLVESRTQVIRISSPIPPPEIMKAYNLLMPDATERFFKLAEKQSAHRQEIETIEVKGQNKRANIGLVAGWLTLIIFAIIGGFLLWKDKNIEAYTLFALAIIPRLFSFFIARYDKKLEKNN